MEQSKETLLIVDDSRLQHAVLNEIFSPVFNILEVSSGEECLQMIKDKKNMIDLVLLDLVMQGMDGFDVLKHRQEMPEFKQIPVVVLTTTDTPEVQTKAFELGASDFLSKPTEPAIARHRIDNILKTNRRLNHILQKQEALRMIGIPPPTLASNIKLTFFSFASAISSAPFAATNALFEVVTCFPTSNIAFTKV